jgi:hypothetical protein
MEKLTILELKKKLERLTLPRIRSETAKIILKDRLIIQRKQDELKSGSSSKEGEIIGEYASESYAIFKERKNPLAGGTVDLILTGSTKNNLKVISLGNGEFELESTDIKWNSLVEKYGDNITLINFRIFNGLQQTEYAPKLMERLRQIMK